jgi:putative copper export protein
VIDNFTTSRRLWWGVPLLLIILWVAASLLPPSDIGIPQAPWLTWISMPVVRFARDIAAALTVGCVLVGGLVVPRRSVRVLQWASAWALIWLALLVVQFILTISDVLAVSLSAALDPTTMWSVMTQVDLGRVFVWQFVGVLAVGVLAQAIVSRATAWVVFVIASAACLAPAFLGHGGLSGGHAIATISLAIHLVAISIWLGGLVALVCLLVATPNVAETVLPRFSAVALGVAIVAAESGLLNSSIRLTQPALFLTTWYGALVIAKVILIGWLAYFGMLQRRKVIPQLDDEGTISTSGLARYAVSEFLVMGLAVGVAVSMSRIGPVATPNANGAVNLLTIAVLLLGLPQLAPLLGAQSTSSIARTLGKNPEVVAVVSAVVTIELFGLNLLNRILGVQFGSLVSIVLTILVGWALSIALSGGRQRSGVYTAIAGWIITCGAVSYFQVSQPQSVVDTRSVAAATVLGVAFLALYFVKPLTVSSAAAQSESIESPTP